MFKRWKFLRNGTTFFPGSISPILVAPANINRVGLVIQVLNGKIRIGGPGVTVTTGLYAEKDKTDFIIFDNSSCPTGEVWVIGDGGSAEVLVQQIEAP